MVRQPLSFLAVPVAPAFVIAIVAALCVLKLAIVPEIYDYEGTVRELPFGFGPRTEAVAQTGSLTICTQPGACTFASRMPLMPYVFAVVTKLVGDDLLRIALLKTAMLDFLMLYFLTRFLAIVGADFFTLGLLSAVFAGPQFMLHSFSPYYEEGFLIVLLAVLFIVQLIYALRREDGLATWMRLPTYVAASAAMYLLKSSMIIITAWNIAALCLFTRVQPRARITAAVLMCLPPLLWGMVVHHVTGRFAIGTSIDGLNLLQGNNPTALELYPRYTLDITFGDGPLELDGRRIERRKLSDVEAPIVGSAAADEWQLDDAHRTAAIAWAIGHVGDELRLVARKLGAFFFDIRNNPRVPGDEKPPALQLVAGMAWMAAMRIILWSAIVAAGLAIWRGRLLRMPSVCFLALLASYALPYIVGFAFERHVVPILLPAALFLVTRWRFPDFSPSAPRPAGGTTKSADNAPGLI